VQLEQQHVAQLIQGKQKDSQPEAIEAAKRDFLDLLRQNSPIASEKLLSGKMDDEELESRVDVYLRDHPALTGSAVGTQSNDPRKRVAELLKRDPSIAGSDVERLALADRFLERLAQRSRMAHDDLVKGKMTEEELQSRVTVYIADVHAETTASAVDPKKAAAAAVVESYLKANFGLSTEHPNAISFRGEIEAGGTKRQFVIFKKRPNKIRMHIVEDGLVVGIFSFDGTTAWRQEPSKPAITLAGAEAAALVRSARFDDQLMDYRERGAAVQLEEKTEKGSIQLHLRETDGSEMIAEIDPATFNLLVSRSRDSGGEWAETRFSEFHKVGALNMAYVQEEWAQGKLKSTTRVSDVRLDSGLLDQIFAYPTNLVMGYMDYMGGLALLKAQQKQHVPYLPKTSKTVP
jgi:outer membrane lipoprotein-sorting protein